MCDRRDGDGRNARSEAAGAGRHLCQRHRLQRRAAVPSVAVVRRRQGRDRELAAGCGRRDGGRAAGFGMLGGVGEDHLQQSSRVSGWGWGPTVWGEEKAVEQRGL